MPVSATPQIAIPTVLLVITLCGALVLLLLDIWLRRKGVKDPTLVWLYVSVLSWSVSAATQMLPASWLANQVGLRADQVPYVFSPISSLLFTVTAFRLSRVRDVFRREELQVWPPAIILVVLGLSFAAIMSLFLGYPEVGKTLDATASCLALMVLAGGLLFSFYKYGNQLLAGLSGVTFTFLIARQFIGAAHGEMQGLMAALQIAGTSTLVMLLIALTVAWGLSETSRLRIVGTPSQVTVIAMFFDLRGSTEWTHKVIRGDYNYAGTFIDHLRTWAWEKAEVLMPERPNLVKFLGDGFLFVWESPQNAQAIDDRTRAVAQLAWTLHREYPTWAGGNSALWKTVPGALGIGMDVGSAIRLTFENGSEDYLGEPISNAAKLQDAARPSGGVVIRSDVLSRFAEFEQLQEKFPRSGEVRLLDGEALRVHATEEVDICNQDAVGTRLGA